MKNKFWFIILAIIFVSTLIGGIFLMSGGPSPRAEVISDGTSVIIVDLATDQEFTVESPNGGTNTVTVRDGKIAVTAATCPDHYCMDRGFCNSGTQIVCLPNRLVIRFLDEEIIDGVVG